MRNINDRKNRTDSSLPGVKDKGKAIPVTGCGDP
jgi:hypothetical protein